MSLEQDVKPYLPIVLEAVKGPDQDFRIQAAEVLAARNHDPKTVVSILIDGLKDKDPLMRQQCAVVLGNLARLGTLPSSAVLALGELLKDSEVSVRLSALSTLHSIQPTDKALLPAIAGLLKDKDSAARQSAVQLLNSFGIEAAPLLLEALKDPDDGVRREALFALADLAPMNESLLPALSALLKDDKANPGLRNGIAELLGGMGKGATGPLTQVLVDKDAGLRGTAAAALGRIGPDSKPAVPRLTELARKDPDSNVRVQAVISLAQIDPASLSVLLELAKDKDHAVRGAAVSGLGRSGAKAAKTTVPVLIEALNDPRTRLNAIGAFGEIGPPAKSALPALTKLTSHKDPEVREQAENAVQRINLQP